MKLEFPLRTRQREYVLSLGFIARNENEYAAVEDRKSSTENVDQTTKQSDGEDNLPATVTQTSAVDAVLTEYTALRREIDIYHDYQKQIINFGVLFLVGLLTVAFSATFSQLAVTLPFVFLLFPIIFVTFGMMFADITIRIRRIADYLHNCSRKKLTKLLGDDVWRWELYKQKTKLFNRRVSRALDRIRWLVFLLPSISAVLLFVYFQRHRSWIALDYILLVFDSIYIVSLVTLVFMIEETVGMSESAILED